MLPTEIEATPNIVGARAPWNVVQILFHVLMALRVKLSGIHPMLKRSVGACSGLLSLMLIASSLSQQACQRACAQSGKFGLSITVRDASTGDELCKSSVVAFDHLNGTYRESLHNIVLPDFPSAPCEFRGAEEREGIYRVEISSPGYISKTEDGLFVGKEDSSDCHIIGVERTVMLERDPSVPREVDASTD